MIRTAEQFLSHYDFDVAYAQTQLEHLHQRQIDYADIFFQTTQNESFVLEDKMIKGGSFNIDQGFGLRVVSGEKTGFSYSDEINQVQLKNSANMAKSIAAHGGKVGKQGLKEVKNPQFYASINPLSSWTNEHKTTLLKELDAYIRKKEPLIKEVTISLSGSYEEVLIIATDGTLATDVRPLVRLSISVLAQEGERREQGSAGGGARCGYEFFEAPVKGQSRSYYFADEAIRQAVLNLSAEEAPAGEMSVILGAGWPGVLLHEAVGHGLEGDFNRKNSSVFSGRIGEQVTSPLCTIVDDATMINRRGSLSIDDEGTIGQYTTLIEKGYLRGYLQDKHNAHLMGVTSTGNGRRESYAHLPMPRMTNTYMLPGESQVEDMIASVDRGIYAVNFSGGQVDITSGNFVFSSSEAYLIENGKIKHPIKGATLIGSGIEAMQKISMVGNDLALDEGVGVCGKAGQSIPVGVGQPSLKLDRMTIGGTQG